MAQMVTIFITARMLLFVFSIFNYSYTLTCDGATVLFCLLLFLFTPAPLFNAFIMVSMPTASYTRLVPPINTIKTNTTGFNRYVFTTFYCSLYHGRLYATPMVFIVRANDSFSACHFFSVRPFSLLCDAIVRRHFFRYE